MDQPDIRKDVRLFYGDLVTVQLGQNDSPVTIVSGDIQKDQF